VGLREGEAELREEAPDAAPAAGEDAGPNCVASGEAEEDEDEDVVGERAEAVLAGGGGLGALGGGLPGARLHGNGIGLAEWGGGATRRGSAVGVAGAGGGGCGSVGEETSKGPFSSQKFSTPI